MNEYHDEDMAMSEKMVRDANQASFTYKTIDILRQRELTVPMEYAAWFSLMFDKGFTPEGAADEFVARHMTKQRFLVSYQVMAWTKGRWEQIQYGLFTQEERQESIDRAEEWENSYGQRTIVKQHTTGTIFDSNLGGEL